MRASSRPRSQPPRPSGKRAGSSTNWVTLREAEAATGVPVNTLRKWVRKSDLPSYLESDGDIALRMVDLDAVVARAKELGRTVEPNPAPLRHDETPTASTRTEDQDVAPDTTPEPSTVPEPTAADGTMIVPIDAWNKMLNQLGNLHEAGQQLAEARERAAKAETEARFLRERLAEIRATNAPVEIATHQAAESDESDVPDSEPAQDSAGDTSTVDLEAPAETTTYWRYLTTGWRDRKKRRYLRD